MHGEEWDRYGRLFAICRAGDEDLGRRMVREGYAVAIDDHSAGEEEVARDARRGLWQGAFQRPADDRAAYPRD